MNGRPDITDARNGEACRLRNHDAAKQQTWWHAIGFGSFDFTFGERKHCTAIDFGLISARNYTDGQCTGDEDWRADEALRAEQGANLAQHRTAAEIEQGDDQKIGDAAKHCRIAVSRNSENAL